MSKPPLMAIMGTFGSGPDRSGVFPDGDGHCSQKYAVPSLAAQFPNGPRLPAGRFETAESIAARRLAGGVLGDHGKWPSAQFVAALSPKLRSSGLSWFDVRSKSKMRS